MLEISAFINCCFLCSVIFIEYDATMHCNEAYQVDPIYCDIFVPAERVPIYGQPINLRYIHKRVPALASIHFGLNAFNVHGTIP